MQKRLANFIIFVSIFLLAACSSPTTATPIATATPVPKPITLYYSTYDNTSGQATLISLDGFSGKPHWKYTTSANDTLMPTLGEGGAYVAANTSLIALDASDGSVRWNTPVPADTGIVGEENSVLFTEFFSSTNGGALNTSLVAFDTNTGKMHWSYQFHNGEADLLADGVLYSSDTLTPFGTPTSPDGDYLLALNASDGSLKWQSTQESGYLTPISVAQGLLYADKSFPMGGPESIEAYRISDGSLAWKYPGDSGHATYIGMDNNILYMLNNGGNPGPFLVALNANTGDILWQVQVQSDWQEFVEPQMVFLGDGADDTLTALNSADGKQLWQTTLGTPGSDPAALVSVGAVTNGVVYLASPDGFAALNASTGAITWEAHDPLTHDPSGHPILAVRGGILYSRSDTTLVARSGSTGALLWSQNVGLTDDPIVG